MGSSPPITVTPSTLPDTSWGQSKSSRRWRSRRGASREPSRRRASPHPAGNCSRPSTDPSRGRASRQEANSNAEKCRAPRSSGPGTQGTPVGAWIPHSTALALQAWALHPSLRKAAVVVLIDGFEHPTTKGRITIKSARLFLDDVGEAYVPRTVGAYPTELQAVGHRDRSVP